MKRIIQVTVLLVIALAASCAPNNPRFIDQPAGFFTGLWHGLICWITFIISLFTRSVRLYEVHNTGLWYDFGFLLGASIALGGGHHAPKKIRKRKCCSEPEKTPETGSPASKEQ